MERTKILDKNDYLFIESDGVQKEYRILERKGHTNQAVIYLAECRDMDNLNMGYLIEFYPAKEETGKEVDYAFERNSENHLTATRNTEAFGKASLHFKEAFEQSVVNVERQLSGESAFHRLLNSMSILQMTENNEKKEDFLKKIRKLFGKDEIEFQPEIAGLYVWFEFEQHAISMGCYIDRLYEKDISGYEKLKKCFNAYWHVALEIKALKEGGLLFSGLNLSDVMFTADKEYFVKPESICVAAPSLLLADKEGEAGADVFAFASIVLSGISREHLPVSKISSAEDEEVLLHKVEQSELLERSEGFSKPYFKHKLLEFLKKYLRSGAQRLYTLDDMILEFSQIIEILQSKQIVEQREKAASKASFVSVSGTALQKLLYDRPLYHAFDKEQKQFQILVIGGGAYAQNFVDQALQAVQIPGWNTKIKVISATKDLDKNTYLEFRSGILEFVRIDGEYAREENDEYAELEFEELGKEACFVLGDRTWNEAIAKKICEANHEYRYIFIALGNDGLNEDVAEAFFAIAEDECMINYAVDYKKNLPRQNHVSNCSYAVWMREKELSSDKAERTALENMAFSAHLSWFGTLNVDERKLRSDFQKSYYDYASSMAFALSIPYKLYSVGVDISAYKNMANAARRFEEIRKNGDTETKILYAELIFAEHKRWVLEKVCAGWMPLKRENGQIDYERCLEIGKAKDAKNLKHACLVHSSPELALQTPEYQENNYAKWDNPSRLDENLCELDSFSLEFHRRWKKKADKLKEKFSFSEGKLGLLDSLLQDGNEMLRYSYSRYVFFLENLFENASKSFVSQYDDYEKDLIENVKKQMSGEDSELICKILSEMKKEFSPVIASLSYTDYKKIDATLIEQIPFIMTYRKVKTLAMGFAARRNNTESAQYLFQNVALANVLYPEKILYLYHYTKKDREKEFLETVRSVLEYLDKHVQCQVEFRIAVEKTIHINVMKSIKEKMEKFLHEYPGEKAADRKKRTHIKFHACKCMQFQSIEGEMTWLANSLYGRKDVLYNAQSPLFEDERDRDTFLQIMETNEISLFTYQVDFERIRSWSGDSAFLDFIDIRTLSYMRVDDMFAISGAKRRSYEFLPYADIYQDLWNIYCGDYISGVNERERKRQGANNWNALCRILRTFAVYGAVDGSGSISQGQSLLFSFYVREYNGSQEFETAFSVPAFAFHTYQKLLAALQQFGVVKPGWSIKRPDFDHCHVVLQSKYCLESFIKKCLQHQCMFLEQYEFEVSKQTICENGRRKTSYNVTYDCPYVTIRPDGGGRHDRNNEGAKMLLDELDKRGYIRILKDPKPRDYLYQTGDTNCLALEYTSKRIKKLFQREGTIWEIYAYYSILKTGFFDETLSNYEFNWLSMDENNTNPTRNELDLVVTKNFKSLFIECKSVYQLNQDYYQKIENLKNRFGINARAVILTNLYEENQDNPANTTAMNRGRDMNVATLSTPEEIENAGVKLLEIMEMD